ncbi:MAG: glycosyltransferase family 9 protein [Armatimonas sp.]
MERFVDQPLGERPHLAVFGSDKVGNFVVTTPLLRGLKEKYPDASITFFGSTTTADLEAACPYIDARLSLYGATGDVLGDFHSFVTQRVSAAGPIALAINCDGFSPLTQALVPLTRPHYAAGQVLRADLRLPLSFPPGDPRAELLKDSDWNGPGMVARHPNLLTSNYFGEMLCRLAYVETDFFHVEVGSEPPPFEVPDILVHMTTTRPAKMWLPEYWGRLLSWCDSEGISVGLVGSKPELERELYGGGFEEELLATTKLRDLRGRTKLTELAGAFAQARAAVVVDAGPLHLAVGVGCPTIALFGNDADGDGASPVRLWGPRGRNVLPVVSQEKCTVCVENRFKNADCLVEGHPCMQGLTPDSVIAALARTLGK